MKSGIPDKQNIMLYREDKKNCSLFYQEDKVKNNF